MELTNLKFPIGQYNPKSDPTDEELERWIMDIDAFPTLLNHLVKELTVEKLQWKYRPDGWMIKQLVHHCADSHMNAFIRFKLTLTENTPVIRPYLEDKWAELTDATQDDLSDSLSLIAALHKKWVLLLMTLSSEELHLEFEHPEHGKKYNLADTIGNYAWHCNHHLAHVKQALAASGKYR